MPNPEIPYHSVKELIKNEERPVTAAPLRLKDGNSLENITPYTVVETRTEGKRTLSLFYLGADNKAGKVDIGDIEGLSVVEGEAKYAGKLLVSFYYYKPDTDPAKQIVEPQPRKLWVREVKFGVTPHHDQVGEKPDFYFFGEDAQYWQKPPDQRERQFPLWRCSGVYGDSREIEPQFKK